MRIVLIASFCLMSCSSCSLMDETQFFVVNPEYDKTNSWEKHEGLPVFNAGIHSDGCSGGMSAIYSKLQFLHKKHGKTLAWRKCCVIHDEAYYYGGTKKEKQKADFELKACVTGVVGNRHLGNMMHAAVEIGGGPNLPTSYRWGYGEDFKNIIN